MGNTVYQMKAKTPTMLEIELVVFITYLKHQLWQRGIELNFSPKLVKVNTVIEHKFSNCPFLCFTQHHVNLLLIVGDSDSCDYLSSFLLQAKVADSVLTEPILDSAVHGIFLHDVGQGSNFYRS